jgi:hypothetical protein
MAQVFLRLALGFILLGALAPTVSRVLLAGEAAFAEVCSADGLHRHDSGGSGLPAAWNGHDCPYCLSPNLAAGVLPGVPGLLLPALAAPLLRPLSSHQPLIARIARKAHPVRAPPALRA